MKPVEPKGPLEWARFINLVLDEAYGQERHPISVMETAKTFTASKYQNDPIQMMEGGDFPGLEGMLVPAPQGQKGWAIFFNHQVPSKRRIRFTLAHEFGHYLLHRQRFPKGLQCANAELPTRNRALATIEEEADIFASNLLMPIEDYKRQIGPDEFTDLNMLGCAADRYGVSMLAAIRQWLRYTNLRAVLVVSDEGFFDWSESSKAAKRTGHKFPSFASPPTEIPADSLAAKRDITNYPKDGVPMAAGIWFKKDPVLEMAVFADRYDFIASLLILDFENHPEAAAG